MAELNQDFYEFMARYLEEEAIKAAKDEVEKLRPAPTRFDREDPL